MRKMIIYGTVTCILFSLTMLVLKPLMAKSPLVKRALMDTYQGSTVIISGRIIFPAYKKGQQIRIIASALSTEGKPPTLIAVRLLSQPGDYSLKMPQNIGDVGLRAVAFSPEKKIPPELSLLGIPDSPLEVGFTDIKGVDITIPE